MIFVYLGASACTQAFLSQAKWPGHVLSDILFKILTKTQLPLGLKFLKYLITTWMGERGLIFLLS